LKPDYLVIYDRGTTSLAAFKKFHIDGTGPFTISGQSATMTPPSGTQTLYLTALLPGGAVLSSPPINTTLPNGSEITSHLIEDGGTPTDIRFLNTLIGADSGTPAPSVALLQSSSGTAFDGAVIGGNVAVLFIHSVSDLPSFASVTFTTNAAQRYVTGLSPNTSYHVDMSSAPAYTISTSGVGATFTTDAAGVLSF
jgi:hypothetical protein